MGTMGTLRKMLLRGAALAICMAALGLAACGGQSVGGGNQNCGAVHSAAGGAITQGTSTAVDCFWHAYSSCQSATLQFSVMGVDTTESHTLTIQSVNGTCHVTDSATYNQVSGNTHVTKTYACSGMRQSGGGLVIEQCGEEGSLVIPAPNGTPAP